MESKHMTDAFNEVQEARERLHQLDIQLWLKQTVFTWEWWLLVGFTIIPLMIWWKLLDKRRAYEIAFYGCMINIMAIVLDDIGTNLSWWEYPVKLIPMIPPLLTADSILVPIFFMLVYQLCSSTWPTFMVANLIMALIIAFVAEPLFIWIEYYRLNEWKLIYSFLFYMSSTTLARFIILKIGVAK
ncbi:CBO0543 family protein [Paenibacillus cremeus]|uniref:Uncharacterized protein n=1 Tax=Paenibacillus cremeus TaxID=2163881 RepID=A0A559KF54_9BACL|nr:CBO0543 family protein [Paenibacillus cremeus]TVY10748.1 hypothetical protein FPZ49_06490 [Paenibacillus cremeus]